MLAEDAQDFCFVIVLLRNRTDEYTFANLQRVLKLFNAQSAGWRFAHYENEKNRIRSAAVSRMLKDHQAWQYLLLILIVGLRHAHREVSRFVVGLKCPRASRHVKKDIRWLVPSSGWSQYSGRTAAPYGCGPGRAAKRSQT